MTDLLTPSETLALLTQLDIRPQKKLGQNFLIDSNIVQKSLVLGAVVEGDNIVEVGPGLGALTRGLIQKGANVFAVERDPKLYEYLLTLFDQELGEQFKIINEDAVAFPLAENTFQNSEVKVIANLPYSITSPWLEGVLESSLPKKMVLLVQKEAADRVLSVANCKQFSALTIFVAGAYRKSGIYPVSANCFYPKPKVDSVLMVLQRRESPFLYSKKSKNIVRELFMHRRKRIGRGKSVSAMKDIVAEWAVTLGLEDLRPEQVDLEFWEQLELRVRNS